MNEITKEQVDQLIENGAGVIISPYGAVRSDAPEVVYAGEAHLEGKWFLLTQDDLEHSKDGVLVRLRDPENTEPLPDFFDIFEVEEY